jgi:D-alanyl-D-alanine dipeptidase
VRLAIACALTFAATACGRPGDAPHPDRVGREVGADARPAAFLITAKELVTAVVDDWSSTRATMRRYRRDGDRWTPVGEPWPGVIGAAGAAWGNGLHGIGAPAGRGGPLKREGDDRSPAGVFALRGAYGDAETPRGTQLPYTRVDADWKCVDDPRSSHYATILDRRGVTVDWTSAEDMHRTDVLYRWVIDVDHNGAHTPSAGSCIFLHVWSGADSATAGCTAMAEPKLVELVTTLDRSAVFVLLPQAEYAALAPSWGLP